FQVGQALAERQSRLGELAVELGGLLIERDRSVALPLSPQHFALAVPGPGEQRIHLLGGLEGLTGLVVLPPLEPHLAHAGTSLGRALARRLLEQPEGIVQLAGLQRRPAILELVGPRLAGRCYLLSAGPADRPEQDAGRL